MSQIKAALGPQAMVNSSNSPNTRLLSPMTSSEPCDAKTEIPKSESDIRQNPDIDSAYHSTNSSDDKRCKSVLRRTSPAQEETKPPSKRSPVKVEEVNPFGAENPSILRAHDVYSTSSKTTETAAHHHASIQSDIANSTVSKHEKSIDSVASKKPGSDASKSGDATSSSTVAHKTEEGDLEEDGPRPDVLYQLRLEIPEEDQYRFYYSDKRYPEWSDPRQNETKRSTSKIEMIRTVEGKWREEYEKNQLKSMEEHQWRMNDLHVDFKKHFRIEKQSSPEMLIHDPVFREAMKSLIKYDPFQDLTGDEIYIKWPWNMLMHYYEEIVSLRDSFCDSEAASSEISKTDRGVANSKKVQSINVILKLIKDDYETVVHPELRNHTKSRVAEFGKLWLLFRPGEEVFAIVNGKVAAFIVLAYRDHEPGTSATTHAPIKQFIVYVWNLRFVAGRLVRHTSKIAIDKYEGTRLIETLPVYPCKYGPKDHSKQKLIERGQRFFEIIQQPHAYMKHTGLTQDKTPRSYNGGVIIDSLSYVKYGPGNPDILTSINWDCLRSGPKREKNLVHFEPVKPSEVAEPEDYGGGELWKKYIDLDPLDPKTKEPGFLEDRHYLLCPSIIRGFSLKGKQWETYAVDSLTKIDWPHGDPFKGLILEGEKESLYRIMANCRSAESRQESPDLLAEKIGGKGAGTVILLHGPPGVGKTYTVDCIANYTKQPLLSLSGCDMGQSEDLEARVQHWFELARAWDALVLLDEADIFLTYRQKNDRERNLLVSVFLQAIEAFPGVLFLATNRIGQLDTAINSRIDVDINFKKLENEGKDMLWKQFFQTINADCKRLGAGPHIQGRDMDKLFNDPKFNSSKLSGRDIRNVFKQATRRARYDNLSAGDAVPKQFKLKPRHIIKAMEHCENRIQYILKANGVESEEGLAEKRAERQASSPILMSKGDEVSC